MSRTTPWDPTEEFGGQNHLERSGKEEQEDETDHGDKSTHHGLAVSEALGEVLHWLVERPATGTWIHPLRS